MSNSALDLTQVGVIHAVIDEYNCIGCKRCIDACPVDAILGAAKHMHTVIASECTGCQLCIPPCPVDCITMQDCTDQSLDRLSKMQTAQQRYDSRQRRLQREQAERAARLRTKKITRKPKQIDQDPRKLFIAAAIARAQKRKAEQKP